MADTVKNMNKKPCIKQKFNFTTLNLKFLFSSPMHKFKATYSINEHPFYISTLYISTKTKSSLPVPIHKVQREKKNEKRNYSTKNRMLSETHCTVTCGKHSQTAMEDKVLRKSKLFDINCYLSYNIYPIFKHLK